LNHNSLNII